MSQRIRVGIIGAGGIARSRHLPNLREIANVDVVAVSNRSTRSATQVASEWDIPDVIEDWRDLIARPDIDAVFIATPPFLHKEMSIASLEAGKHTFCQARMAMDYEDALEMAAAARKAGAQGIKSQLCIAPDGLPVDKAMRELLDDDFFGQLTHGVAVIGTDSYLDPSKPLHWRQMDQFSGFNTLSLGIFIEAIHRWIGEFHRVKALTHTVTRYRRVEKAGDNHAEESLAAVDRPDIVSVIAEHSTGAVMSFVFSGVARSYERFVELHGTKRSIRHVLGETAIEVNDGSGWETNQVPQEDLVEWTAEKDFIESILTDGPIKYPNPDFQDGLKYMAFTEAVFRSAASGQGVSLPLQTRL